MRAFVFLCTALGISLPAWADFYWTTESMHPRLLTSTVLEVEHSDSSGSPVAAIAHANTRTNSALRWSILALDLISLGKFNPLLNLARQKHVLNREGLFLDARIEYGTRLGFHIPISTVHWIENLSNAHAILAPDEAGWWQAAQLQSVRFPARSPRSLSEVRGEYVFESSVIRRPHFASIDTLETFPEDLNNINHPAVRNGVLNVGPDPVDSLPVFIHSVTKDTLYVIPLEQLMAPAALDDAITYVDVGIYAVSRKEMPLYHFASHPLYKQIQGLSNEKKVELTASLGPPVLISKRVQLTVEGSALQEDGNPKRFFPRDLRYVLHEIRSRPVACPAALAHAF